VPAQFGIVKSALIFRAAPTIVKSAMGQQWRWCCDAVDEQLNELNMGVAFLVQIPDAS
jgi:hypothetical protein